MPLRVDAQTAADRWVTGLGQAGQKITDGVSRVNVSPGQLAAQKAQKWQQAVNDAAPKWQRRVAAVSLEDWRQAMVNKGIPRVAQGAQQSQTKMASALTPLFSYMSTGLSRIDAMDDTTVAARINKAVAWMQYMSGYQAP